MQVRLATLLLLSWLLWSLNARADGKVFSQVIALIYMGNGNTEVPKLAGPIFETDTKLSDQVRKSAWSVVRSGSGSSPIFTLALWD